MTITQLQAKKIQFLWGVRPHKGEIKIPPSSRSKIGLSTYEDLPRLIQGKTIHGQMWAKCQREKQKMKAYYGCMRDYVFKKYCETAVKSKIDSTEHLMKTLETRLDTLLYRTGFVLTIQEAQNWISRGHVLVNDRLAIIKRRRLKPGDMISIHPDFIQQAARAAHHVAEKRSKLRVGPGWIAPYTRLDADDGINNKMKRIYGMLPYLEIYRNGLSAVLVRYPSANELHVLQRAMMFPQISDADLNPRYAMMAYRKL